MYLMWCKIHNGKDTVTHVSMWFWWEEGWLPPGFIFKIIALLVCCTTCCLFTSCTTCLFVCLFAPQWPGQIPSNVSSLHGNKSFLILILIVLVWLCKPKISLSKLTMSRQLQDFIIYYNIFSWSPVKMLSAWYARK